MISAYHAFTFSAGLLGVAVLYHELRAKNLPVWHAFVIPLLALPVGHAGARILYTALNDDWDGLTPQTLFASGPSMQYGAVFALTAALAIYGIAVGIGATRLLAICTPAAAAAVAVGRGGCLWCGCCRGRVFWNVEVPAPAVSAVLSLCIFVLLLRIDSGRSVRRLGVFCLLTGTERFLLEAVRVNLPVHFGLTATQLLAIPVVVGGGLMVAASRPELSAPVEETRRVVDTK